MSTRTAIAALSMALVGATCEAPAPPQAHRSSFRDAGELVVLAPDTPIVFQDTGSDSGGFEFDLVKLLAQELAMPVRFVVVHSRDDLLRRLDTNDAHFAVAVTLDGGHSPYPVSNAIREIRHVLVQHEDVAAADSIEELAGKTVEVVGGSPEAALLNELKRRIPDLTIVERPTATKLELLERVAQRKADATVADSALVDVALNFHPELRVAMAVSPATRVVWAFPPRVDPELYDRVQAFIRRVRKDGTLARLFDRYFGHIHRLNAADTNGFLASVRGVLPKYRRDFISAEELTGLDWRLLAALAYQESQWDPLATSPTGVRGMLMLTGETADRLHVTDRLDAKESIRAGARYLADLRDELPATIHEPDRTWLALAGYNLGMGHLNGGRAIARSLKHDDTSWYEMKSVLPLMSRPDYAARLKSGRARGGEAVIMVENIRTYYDILMRYETPHRVGPKARLPVRSGSSTLHVAHAPSARSTRSH